MPHATAQMIFCFFAEDTDIFSGKDLFTDTIARMSERDSSNTHEVIGELFRAMNTKREARASAGTPRWADAFPYVNGELFSGSVDTPRFSKIARSYLLHIGRLDWTKINPDIFGSMIQAVAEDEERGALGMHYTSVPNILKVLNPLFLDNLRARLEEAGDNPRKLLNLRNRLAKIRVFDPACGSGNFLVIAYKQMRAIEAEINKKRGQADRRTEIPLTNFRGIELRDFPAEVARLALIIAEFQCDVLYRGQKEALQDFLPLDAQNWITCGNALRLDWLSICPPTGTGVKHHADDLFEAPVNQAEIDFENQGGETYICGNPPYVWTNDQSTEQKNDLRSLFEEQTSSWKSLNYVTAWFLKAAAYSRHTPSESAFVAVNTICQGQGASILWPVIFSFEQEIKFAHTSFRWSNLARNNAGVTVVVVGLTRFPGKRTIYTVGADGSVEAREVDCISPYLTRGSRTIVEGRASPLGPHAKMVWGNKPSDGGHLLLAPDEKDALVAREPRAAVFVRQLLGSQEMLQGQVRYCIWVDDDAREKAIALPSILERIEKVAAFRSASTAAQTRSAATIAHRFRQIQDVAQKHSIIVPSVSSEGREGFPIGFSSECAIVSSRAFAIYDAPLYNFSLLSARLHLVWLDTVCGKLESRYSYSSTLGWHSFPVPPLTEKNKADLTRCAEDILLAREAHFPATIADLYDSEEMPQDLREAHERNDEVLERIYIGRRFRNDTERLEKLFELYTKMIALPGAATKKKRAGGSS